MRGKRASRRAVEPTGRTTRNAIELEGLTRIYTRSKTVVRALDGIDLEVPTGQTLALLGENGAGKTTLTKILATLLLPSSGCARVFGYDVRTEDAAVRALTNVVFGGDRGLYPMLSGRENLRYFGVLNGLSPREMKRRSSTVLSEVGLEDAAERRVETYSKGMRQRLHIAIGMLTSPSLLLLDEPTVGLDPNEAERLRSALLQMREVGTTVLLTSHNLLDVERLADRVVMIASGRISHDLPVAQFRALTGVEAVVTVTLSGQHDPAVPGAAVGHHDGTTVVSIPVRQWSSAVLHDISAALGGYDVVDIQVRTSTLEDAFALASQTSVGTPWPG